jgi:predicted metal-binding membrane protein
MASVVNLAGAAPAVAPAGPGRLARWRVWHPEWPAAVLAGLAWVVLLAGELAPSPGAGGVHAHHHMVHRAPGVLAQQPGWMVMTVAMMVPVALPALGYVAHNSLRSRQGRAMALFLVAFLLPWPPFGIAATAAYAEIADRRLALAGTLVLAAAWQLTRTKRRALVACARTVPLAPTGRRADLACVRFGVLHAARCLRSCWALMLVMIPAGHGLGWMIAVTALVLAEQRHPRTFTLPPARVAPATHPGERGGIRWGWWSR